MKNSLKKNPTQKTKILWHLKAGKTITPLQALAYFNCFRLGARIWDIKQMGFKIKRELITTNSGKVVAEYSLIKGYTQGKLF